MFTTTIFCLGIDSAFSFVEAVVSAVEDSKIGQKLSKKKICMIICGVGAIGSVIFTFNWGFILFQITDHYINNYLILLVGLL